MASLNSCGVEEIPRCVMGRCSARNSCLGGAALAYFQFWRLCAASRRCRSLTVSCTGRQESHLTLHTCTLARRRCSGLALTFWLQLKTQNCPDRRAGRSMKAARACDGGSAARRSHASARFIVAMFPLQRPTSTPTGSVCVLAWWLQRLAVINVQ